MSLTREKKIFVLQSKEDYKGLAFSKLPLKQRARASC